MNDKLATLHARGTFGLLVGDLITSAPENVTEQEQPIFSVKLAMQPSYGQGNILGRWSGKTSGFEAPPAIGAEVYLSINNIGPGTVTGYFIESGYLGVTVTPHNPPQWWLKQNPERKACTVFGTEIKPLPAQITA